MHRVPTPARVSSSRAGFSLVEMIGVLAIIAILAVIIVPRVFSTIAASRITQAAASTNAIKSAVTDFFGRFGTIPVTNNNSRIDDLLVAAQLMDSRFVVRIGNQPTNPPLVGAAWARNAAGAWAAAGGVDQRQQSRIVSANANALVPSAANGGNYQLDGVNPIATGSRVISAVIVNCTANEARELSLRLDGESLTAAAGLADNQGKVVYAAPNGAGNTNAWVYLTHQ